LTKRIQQTVEQRLTKYENVELFIKKQQKTRQIIAKKKHKLPLTANSLVQENMNLKKNLAIALEEKEMFGEI